MNIVCIKERLNKAVDSVCKIIPNTTTLPVLKCIVFEVKDKMVILKSTNIEFGIEVYLPANVKSEGSVAVPADVLSSTLKSLRDSGNIELEVVNNILKLKTKDGDISIKTVSIDDFPNIPKPESKDVYKIQSKIFINGIKSVIQSASKSLIKPELASVYIYYNDGKLYFVSTDQFRLSEKSFNLKINKDIPDIIIPTENANEFVNILNDFNEEELEIYIEENQISIKTSNIYLTSRIIDGSFPDYKAIIPKSFSTKVILLKEDFQKCLSKIKIFTDKFGKMSMYIYPSKKTFTMSSRNSDVGEVFDSPEAVVEGDDLDISFNYKYLSDSVKTTTSDSVNLLFSGEGKPLVVKGVDDDSFVYLVMPMNK